MKRLVACELIVLITLLMAHHTSRISRTQEALDTATERWIELEELQENG